MESEKKIRYVKNGKQCIITSCARKKVAIIEICFYQKTGPWFDPKMGLVCD